MKIDSNVRGSMRMMVMIQSQKVRKGGNKIDKVSSGLKNI